ncbi:hypothetical protein QN357_06670, partial [Cryobacterium sp. RTC2.1]|uniref:hypothetical protein n=1 Tax=Cryobacterium sp. RTC2.1 TaxID=3048634 RepID=UPI002B2399DD
VPATRILSAVSATTAWRASTGACPATSGYLVVSAGRPECAGAQLLTVTDALVPTVAGCYAVSTPSTAMAGTVAVSEAAGTIWLWAGEQVVRSTDSGATFK